jgi:hypothetical protein
MVALPVFVPRTVPQCTSTHLAPCFPTQALSSTDTWARIAEAGVQSELLVTSDTELGMPPPAPPAPTPLAPPSLPHSSSSHSHEVAAGITAPVAVTPTFASVNPDTAAAPAADMTATAAAAAAAGESCAAAVLPPGSRGVGGQLIPSAMSSVLTSADHIATATGAATAAQAAVANAGGMAGAVSSASTNDAIASAIATMVFRARLDHAHHADACAHSFVPFACCLCVRSRGSRWRTWMKLTQQQQPWRPQLQGQLMKCMLTPQRWPGGREACVSTS